MSYVVLRMLEDLICSEALGSNFVMARGSVCVEKTVFLHPQDALNALKASDHKISDARELWCEDWIRCVYRAFKC